MITEKDMEQMQPEIERILNLPTPKALHMAPKLNKPLPACHRCMSDEEFFAMDLPF